jgi:hypothetical protein
MPRPSALDAWTPEAIALGRRWVQIWKDAGPRLEAIRQRELREVSAYEAISRLCGAADYGIEPRAPRPISGLIEQQRLFSRGRGA